MGTIIYLLLIFAVNSACARSAVVITPSSDLVGEPLSKCTGQAKKAYKKLPLCGATRDKHRACPRIHQLLFNEIVDIVEERGDESCIKVPNIFFIAGSNKQPYTTYWTLTSTLMPLDTISSDDRAKIPQPIQYTNTNLDAANTNTVTLLHPWHDTHSRHTFSAGTRFVLTETQPDEHTYQIYRWDNTHQQMRTATIDKNRCITAYGQTPRERIQKFVSVLKQWAHVSEGYIPYVWGGSTFSTVCTHNNFHEKIVHTGTSTYSYYVIDGYHSVPKSGFDCSGLVARAAQLCGIPYFFKNTTTLAHCLAPLTSNDVLQEGDLIWIPGHVMVVSDLKHHHLIEARHYAQGYGKVHEIPLERVFAGVKTYDDLLNRYYQNKSLERLDIRGTVADTIPACKIFKLASSWHYAP